MSDIQLIPFSKSPPEALDAGEPAIERFAPDRRFSDTISVEIDAPAATIFAALRQVSQQDMPVAATLGRLRYLPGRLLGRQPPPSEEAEPFIPMLLRTGTVILEGVCLRVVLKRLRLKAFRHVYVKALSEHGVWSDEADYELHEAIDVFLQKEREAMSAHGAFPRRSHD